MKIAALANEYSLLHRVRYFDAYATVCSIHPDLAAIERATQPHHAYKRLPNVGQVALANERSMAAARQRMVDRVHEVMRAQGIDYNAAWSFVQSQEPALANEAFTPTPIATARTGDTYSPVPDDAACKALGLPTGSSNAVLECAWIANGKRYLPLNAGKIFEALVGLIETNENKSTNEALQIAKSRFMDLWRLVLDAGK